ncbi:hypothetical protein PGB90_000753 [Kerria lacca]
MNCTNVSNRIRLMWQSSNKPKPENPNILRINCYDDLFLLRTRYGTWFYAVADHRHGLGTRSNAERRFQVSYTINSSFREAAPSPCGTQRATDPVWLLDFCTCNCNAVFHMINGDLTVNDFRTLSFDELWDNTFVKSSYSQKIKTRIKNNKNIEEYALSLLRDTRITGNDIKSKLSKKYPKLKGIKKLESIHLGLKNDLIGDGNDIKYEDIVDHFEDLLLEMKNKGYGEIETVKYRRRMKKILNKITDKGELEYIISLIKLTGNQSLYNYFKNYLMKRGFVFEEDTLILDEGYEKENEVKTNVIHITKNSISNANADEIIELSVINRLVNDNNVLFVNPPVQEVINSPSSSDTTIYKMNPNKFSIENMDANIAVENSGLNQYVSDSVIQNDNINNSKMIEAVSSTKILTLEADENLHETFANADENLSTNLKNVYVANYASGINCDEGKENMDTYQVTSDNQHTSNINQYIATSETNKDDRINEVVNVNINEIQSHDAFSTFDNLDNLKRKRKKLYYLVVDENKNIVYASSGVKNEYLTRFSEANNNEINE